MRDKFHKLYSKGLPRTTEILGPLVHYGVARKSLSWAVVEALPPRLRGLGLVRLGLALGLGYPAAMKTGQKMPTRVAEERFAGWLLCRRLHRGAASELWLATAPEHPDNPDGSDGSDSDIARSVVIKRVQPGLPASAQQAAALAHEGRVLSTARSWRLPKLLARGEQAGWPFLVLRHIPGPDLRYLMGRIDGGVGDPSDREAIALAVLGEGLAGLASLARLTPALVHRDISPENFVLAPSGRLVVIDLGISVALGAPAAGPLIGKERYLSPGRREERPAAAADDLYALGVIGWELLHGRHFSAAELHGLSKSAIMGEPLGAFIARLLGAGRRPLFSTATAARRSWRRLVGAVAGATSLPELVEPLVPRDEAPWSLDPGAWRERAWDSAESRGVERTNDVERPGWEVTKVQDL